MPTDTNVKQVIINKLTKAQYDAAIKNPTELYLTPDEPASTTNLGPVKVDGTTITSDADGTIHASSSGVPWGAISGTLSNQTDLQTALNAKQATISDLATIRSGASAGATAVQPAALQTAINSVKRNIGELVQCHIPLTDAGLHLLDGSLINGTGSYAAFVTYMSGLVSSHPELFTTESAWQTSVTDYGVCGEFVYDSTNNTVRLPKTAGARRYLIYSSSNGDSWCLVYNDGWCEQGGRFAGPVNNSSSFTVSFLKNMADTSYAVSFCGTTASTVLTATARYQNSLQFFYSNNTTNVSGSDFSWQIKGYADISTYKESPLYQYIVIANSTKTEIEVDIDEIATDLNRKADVDLSNVSTTSGFRKLVEVYNNGTSWYKVFNEYDPSTGALIGKWGEQGGMLSLTYKTRAYTDITITLLKEMIDTNYSISLSTSDRGNVHLSNWVYSTINTTDFVTRTYSDGASTGTGFWRVSGYIV